MAHYVLKSSKVWVDGFDFSGFVTRADVIRRIQVRAELAGLRE